MRIVIAGCGAVGSQVAWHIARRDHEFLLIDDDRIAEHNVTTGTTMYSLQHVGVQKAVALGELLWRRCGCRVEPHARTLETSRPIVRWKPELVIDGFDNSTARAITTHLHVERVRVPTLHVGVSGARTGEITWDERYEVPPVTFQRGDVEAPCTHELGRQILRFTASVAAGVVEHWIATGEKRDLVVTERMAVLG
jgi:hypothetical protein